MTLATVVTCSDSAATDPALDRSGPLAAGLLAEYGFDAGSPRVVPDDTDAIAACVSAAIEAGSRLVVCTGGTGIGPRDVTPEAVARLGGRTLPGIGEAMRAAARRRVPAADLSRSGAVVVDGAFVLMVPGSPGGVRDGLAVAGPLLAHALDMTTGAGHGSQQPDRYPALVSPDPIDADAVIRGVQRADAGAVVTFEGRVRDHDHGRLVTALSYEGHPDAPGVMTDVTAEAAGRPGVLTADARHRLGDLAVGDLAFFVAVSAAHRGEAFAACSWLVDEAKARLPIWKHQTFSDGTSEWVNCP